MPSRRQPKNTRTGKLRIGDDWNAIRIIALSQNSPLKAVAEFVENSIDAGAGSVTITRGREKGEQYLQITDNGTGPPMNKDGHPDFRYVATHICDSIKKRLKVDGAQGVQGEFGIGLLSFWTVGEHLNMTSPGEDGRVYTMHMRKGDPGFSVQPRRILFAEPGTKIKIAPLLAGLKQLGGEKIQWYLASELRERIRQHNVDIRVIDRVARKEFSVEPRQFQGRWLHQLPEAESEYGTIYTELYLNEPDPTNQVGLYRHGTRVLQNITELTAFQHPPWTEGMLQGVIDAPFLNLTPTTRSGLVHDEHLVGLAEALEPLEETLQQRLEAQRRAENERASRNMLRTIHKAFREALLTLPTEEYDWFDVRGKSKPGRDGESELTPTVESAQGDGKDNTEGGETDTTPQKQFFEFAGPLYRVSITPASCVLPVGKSRTLRSVCRDKNRRTVDDEVARQWSIDEGAGKLENTDGEIATYTAPDEPALVRIRLRATQGKEICEAEALVTVTDSLLPETRGPSSPRQGLPGYTFERATGKLWRSRYKTEQNVIVINNGHRDFVYASRTKALKLRYISRLYAKELVLHNFPGLPADQLLERLIELSLYTEENLK